jgi:DNA-binding Xre family transcriptional regulator
MKDKQATSELLAARRQVSSDDAAEFLGVSLRKIEKMRREGNGPKFVRLSSKLVRYRICDLLEFQEENLQVNNAGLNTA